MPTILLKKSDTASAVPTTANLTNLAGGVEVAVNTADRRMYTMNSSSAVVELGTNPTTLTVSGGANITGNVGIGTASPGAKLDVQGGRSYFAANSDAFATYLRYNNSTAGVFLGSPSADAFQISKSSGAAYLNIDSSGNVGIGKTASTNKLEVSGNISDISGNIRAIPRTGSEKTSDYTLAITDVGQFVQVGTSGSVTVPNNTFATGDVISVFNNTTGNISINCPITTAYIAGTDSDKASVTLSTRGVASVLFINPSLCVITGNVT